MSLRGRVVRRRLAPGSKSEHEGLVLITSDGDYRLRRQGGNAFGDPVLEPLEGHEIECEGIVRDHDLIMTRWTVLD